MLYNALPRNAPYINSAHKEVKRQKLYDKTFV